MTLTSANGDDELSHDAPHHDGESDTRQEIARLTSKSHLDLTTAQASPSSEDEVAYDDGEPRDSDDEDRIKSLRHGKVRPTQEELGQLNEEFTLPPAHKSDRLKNEKELLSSPNRPYSSGSNHSSGGSGRPASSLSQRSNLSSFRQPFDRRYQARKPSSQQLALRNVSPVFLKPHSRQSSTSSQPPSSPLEEEEEKDEDPWEVVRWTKLKKITAQAFSETAKRAFGQRTVLCVAASIVIGTSKGLVLVFDYQQNLKQIIGQGTAAAEAGAVTSLAISADHSTIGSGHASGGIFTWDLASSSKPFLHISPISAYTFTSRSSDVHISGHAVLHIGFLGTRRTALVSADESGMAFSHLATRGLGAVARTVKSTRILGRYPESHSQPKVVRKPSSVLAFSPLPLGNVEQVTDDLGLTALLTPYLMVIISTTPVAQTQYKSPRAQDVEAHSALTGCLAWFPAVRLKSTSENGEKPVAQTKLAYCWSNVLNVLELRVDSPEQPEQDKPPNLTFNVRSAWRCEEAVVSIQWLTRSILALLTVTQRLIILEDKDMRVTDFTDLNPRHIYHRDIFSRQLLPLVDKIEKEDSSMHGVIPDAYGMSFRAYKGRLFLLGTNDVSMGSLSTWSDRLNALIESGRHIKAIELATAYFKGSKNSTSVGLPEQDEIRHGIVKSRLLEIIKTSLEDVFKKDENDELDEDLRSAMQDLTEPIFSACITVQDVDFLYDEVYDWFGDSSCQDFFLYSLEPRILDNDISFISPEILKDLINWFASHDMSDRLEEMICSLDTASMDIDQVTALCKTYNLYDAFIYVWNQALGDYVTPMRELLRLAEDIMAEDRYHEASSGPASKMFPYMAYIFTSRVYPYGTELAPNDAKSAKASLYEFLFSGRRLDQPPRDQTRPDSLATPSKHESYLYLRVVVQFDIASFMSMLNEAFEDSYLNGPQNQLANAMRNEGSSQEISGWSMNRQRIVNILLEVMSGSSCDQNHKIFVDIFIARNLPKFPQFVLLPGSILRQILDELCDVPTDDLADECQLSVEYLLSVHRPADLEKLIPKLEKACFFRVLKGIYKGSKRYAKWLQACFDDDHPETAFNCIVDCLRPSAGLSAKQVRDVKGVILRHGSDLTELDVARTANILQSYAPDLLERIFNIMEPDTMSQYKFLKALSEQIDDTRAPHEDSPSDFAFKSRNRYVQLMCKHDRSHVADYINNSDVGNLRLDRVLPDMEIAGVINAAVVLLARDGLVRDAMDRLVQFLGTLQSALLSILDQAAEKPVNEDVTLDELLATASKYVKLGIWLCQSSPPAGDQPTATLSPSPRRHRRPNEVTEEELSAAEKLWLDLLDSTVKLSLVAIPTTKTPQPPLESHASQSEQPDPKVKVADVLRTNVQSAFTALLTATSASTPLPSPSHQAQNDDDDDDDDDAPFPLTPPQPQSQKKPKPRFLPILRLFLNRLSQHTNPTTPSQLIPLTGPPTLPALRQTLTAILSAYAFEESLLSLASALLDKDVFQQLDSTHQKRARGWRAASRSCVRCGERVWGVGTGVGVWEDWRDRTERGQGERRMARERKGKGKRRIVEREEGDRKGVVVFACGHCGHWGCLVKDEDGEGEAMGEGERRKSGGGGEGLRCPICR